MEREEEVSKNIDKELKEIKKKQQPFRLLLLGCGDAGKTTFAKQLTYLYGSKEYNDQKRQANTAVLRYNCLESIKILVRAAEEWEIQLDDALVPAATAAQEAESLTPAIAAHIKALWTSKPILEVFKRGSQLQLPGGNSNVAYFFDNAERFAASDFEPSQEDYVRAKQKTTGVHETSFEFKDATFVLVDVGGQRCERRRWLPCFQDVSAVIYLSAINEYDMRMEEDETTNRMEESLQLFNKLSCSQWLCDIPFILFLNKVDLFKEKIQHSPLKDFFDDYEEFDKQMDDKMSDFDKAVEYITNHYRGAFQGKAACYTFVTCALDTEGCRNVWRAVRDHIVNEAIQFNM